MTSDVYDPDEVFHHSPKLEPQKIKYKPEESPPPYLPDNSSHSSSSSDSEQPNQPAQAGGSRKRSKRRIKSQTRPSQGDAVLISYLADQNRPDLAQEVGQRPLNSASQSEAESDEEMLVAKVTPIKFDAAATAQAALSQLSTGDDSMGDAPGLHPALGDGFKKTLSNGVGGKHNGDGDIDKEVEERDAAQDSLRLSSPKASRPASKVSTSMNHEQGNSLATSPNLARFAITASESSNMETLPALQKSPPRSSSVHSPEGSQSLPSLQTALGSQLVDSTMQNGSPYPPGSATSPTMARPPLAQGPSPYLPPSMGPSPTSYSSVPTPSSKDSAMSPPSGAPSHPTYWRNPPKSEPSYGAVSGSDGYTPSTNESPSSVYTTPGGQEHIMSIDIERPTLLTGPLPPNGPFNSTGFKCTHAGCTAPPFQTQYLLNSHANVHSSNRPHFCPVKECPRGPGGKGFKRKNEMIRHGLVHDSPGYVCPFCADQQHRYPRPDNLQRYVNEPLNFTLVF